MDKAALLGLISEGIAAIERSPETSQTALARIAGGLDTIYAENQQLRAIVSDCAAAIGNGAFCHPSASIEFMQQVPHEISLRRDALARALVPLKIARDAVLTQRREFTESGFIMFESEIDARVRFTYGHASAILEAATEPQTAEAAHG